MRKTAVLLLVLLALTGAACKKKTVGTQSGSAPDYCTEARALDAINDKVDADLGAFGTGQGSPATLQADVGEFKVQFAKTQPLAPAELSGEFQLFSAVLIALDGLLQPVGYDLTRLTAAQQQQFQGQLASPQLDAAEKRVDDYNFTTCGIPKST